MIVVCYLSVSHVNMFKTIVTYIIQYVLVKDGRNLDNFFSLRLDRDQTVLIEYLLTEKK